MVRLMPTLLLAVLLLSSCSGRQAVDGEIGSSPSDADWSECVAREGEYETCTEVCAAQDMQCAANACQADPMYCQTDGCEMATAVVGIGDGICTDPFVGGFYEWACDDPIPFILNNTARCCCES